MLDHSFCQILLPAAESNLLRDHQAQKLIKLIFEIYDDFETINEKKLK